jgi:hypothetical protein
MMLQDWGAAVGAGLGTAGLVIAGGKKWLSQRAEKKIDAVSVELGVGLVGPSLVSLVASTSSVVATTAAAVGRLETNSEESRNGAAEVLTILRRHGETLENYGRRISVIENRHQTCGFTNERVAELLALKTEEVAKVLADKTEAVAAKLAEKTEGVAEALAQHPAGPKGDS